MVCNHGKHRIIMSLQQKKSKEIIQSKSVPLWLHFVSKDICPEIKPGCFILVCNWHFHFATMAKALAYHELSAEKETVQIGCHLADLWSKDIWPKMKTGFQTGLQLALPV